MAIKKTMTTAEAGALRWRKMSGRKRSQVNKKVAVAREAKRRSIRAAAELALKYLEAINDGTTGCSVAITKLKEALA